MAKFYQGKVLLESWKKRSKEHSFQGSGLKGSLNDVLESLGQEEAEQLAKNGRIQGLEVLLKSKNK